jgi:hypothetical protein
MCDAQCADDHLQYLLRCTLPAPRRLDHVCSRAHTLAASTRRHCQRAMISDARIHGLLPCSAPRVGCDPYLVAAHIALSHHWVQKLWSRASQYSRALLRYVVRLTAPSITAAGPRTTLLRPDPVNCLVSGLFAEWLLACGGQSVAAVGLQERVRRVALVSRSKPAYQ